MHNPFAAVVTEPVNSLDDCFAISEARGGDTIRYNFDLNECKTGFLNYVGGGMMHLTNTTGLIFIRKNSEYHSVRHDLVLIFRNSCW